MAKASTTAATVDVLDASGAKAGSLDLPAGVFDVQTNVPLIHQVVVAQRAAARQGTHKAKGRGEVSGSGHKPFKQKGTGRARQGSIRAPQMTGGGIVHGPEPRNYAQRTPKKMIAAALLGALSDRARGNRVHVVEALVDGDAPSTKSALGLLNDVADSRHVLVVLDRGDEIGAKSVRNIPEVHALAFDQLNAYDVLVADDIVFTRAAFDKFVAARGGARTTSAASEKDADEPEASASSAGKAKASASSAGEERSAGKPEASTSSAGEERSAGKPEASTSSAGEERSTGESNDEEVSA